MYKKCNHCNTENFESAKYCVSCNNQIGQPVQASRQPQPQTQSKQSTQKQRYVFDDTESPEDLIEKELQIVDETFVEAILNHVENKITQQSRKGIKFEDAITIKQSKTAKGGLKESKKKIKKAARHPEPEFDKRDGAQILQELGGNDPRLERDFSK